MNKMRQIILIVRMNIGIIFEIKKLERKYVFIVIFIICYVVYMIMLYVRCFYNIEYIMMYIILR